MKSFIRKRLLESLTKNCPVLPITKEVSDYVRKFESDEQFLRSGGLPIDMLDRLAFGFSDSDITELPPSKLSIKWKDDLENVKWEVNKSGLTPKVWASKVDLAEPIDVSYEKGKFFIEDGHHRYFAAKTLGKKLKINLEIKENPILKLSNLDYDDFHRCLFKQIKAQKVSEQMIDGQNMNKGMQTACNTMSVATYKEGLNLIINAIGTPEQNPEIWKKIAKPLKNWQEADLMIGQEVKEKGMSGDSMVDESNTWWAAIQSTICEQGGNGLNENISNSHLIPVRVGQFVYHKSNPKFREMIKKQGLIPKGKSETWLSDTKINGKVIFATNSNNKDDLFDSTYDDDIYLIDTTKIKNKWFGDPNFNDSKYVITFDPIPVSALKLIYQGTGESFQ